MHLCNCSTWNRGRESGEGFKNQEVGKERGEFLTSYFCGGYSIQNRNPLFLWQGRAKRICIVQRDSRSWFMDQGSWISR
jgi:hypothetical protein